MTEPILLDSELPMWLKQLSKVLESFDPEFAWRLYERFCVANKSSRKRHIETAVVYCEEPRIAVTIGHGVWSLECLFDPRKKKSTARKEQRKQANRNRT